MNRAARCCHIVGDLISPAQIVLGLLMGGGILGRSIYLIERELCGVIVALEHVKTHVAGLLAGIVVVINADSLEGFNEFGLYVYKYKCCKHWGVSFLQICYIYYTIGRLVCQSRIFTDISKFSQLFL